MSTTTNLHVYDSDGDRRASLDPIEIADDGSATVNIRWVPLSVSEHFTRPSLGELEDALSGVGFSVRQP